jgi:hypothetical protein
MGELVVPIEVEIRSNDVFLCEKAPKDLHHLHLNSWGKTESPELTGHEDEAGPLKKAPLPRFELGTY